MRTRRPGVDAPQLRPVGRRDANALLGSDRYSVPHKKSDSGDALVPANILRTDMHAHSPLAQDSDLARAQQDTTWNRQQISNQLRCLLREYVRREVACL
ncbi:hypothetical protein GCM10009647_066820 [Streptomyces sanglieri]